MHEAPFGCLSFCEVRAGMRCRITSDSIYDLSSQRLADLGLVPGAEFIVIREAPFGDPVEIQLNGCNMAVRRNDGCSIIVQEIGKK